MEKPRAVVILGAGASVDFGVPALAGLFKDKDARAHLASDRFLRRSLDDYFWRPRGHSLSTSDQGLTVEEILTLVRDWRHKEDQCEAIDETFAGEFRKSLNILIKKAVFENKSSTGRHLNQLIAFCKLNFSHTTWATFNWDCLFESSFYYAGSSRSNPSVVVDLEGWFATSGRHIFLKLHGGVNWWQENNKLRYLSFGKGGELNKCWGEYENGKLDQNCGPVILEPSAYKYQDPKYRLLKKQWSRFFSELCDADYVIVVGYSLPSGDTEARSNITVAGQVNPTCRWLVIDPSPATLDLFSRLIGESRLVGAETRLKDFNREFAERIEEAFEEGWTFPAGN